MFKYSLTLSNVKNSDLYISDILYKIVLPYLKKYDCMLVQDGPIAHTSRNLCNFVTDIR